MRERMSVGEPRWENVQARDVFAIVVDTCCDFMSGDIVEL